MCSTICKIKNYFLKYIFLKLLFFILLFLFFIVYFLSIRLSIRFKSSLIFKFYEQKFISVVHPSINGIRYQARNTFGKVATRLEKLQHVWKSLKRRCEPLQFDFLYIYFFINNKQSNIS